MFVHIYRVGESNAEGLHQRTERVTMFTNPSHSILGSILRQTVNGDDKPVLVLGTRPNLTVIPMSTIRWFWVEED